MGRKLIKTGAGCTFLATFCITSFVAANDVFATTHTHHTATYIGECGDLGGWYQTYTKTINLTCSTGSTTQEQQQWYKETGTGNTCYVVTNEGTCSTNTSAHTSLDDPEQMRIDQLEEQRAADRTLAFELTQERQRKRKEAAKTRRAFEKWNTSSPASQLSSAGILYEPSDLPEWNFNTSIQGSVKESEMELTPTLGRESDVKSLAVNFSADKGNFYIDNQVYYTSLEGTGIYDSQDTESFGLLLIPGYQFLNQEENGIDFALAGLLEISTNDYENRTQTRLVPGLSIYAGLTTPVGGFTLSNLFTHDRNLNGDEEITGEKYINMNTMEFQYILPLTESLFFTTGLDYTVALDMPNYMEDSSTGISFALDYYGWENYNLGLMYVDSLDGLKNRGFTLTFGHSW